MGAAQSAIADTDAAAWWPNLDHAMHVASSVAWQAVRDATTHSDRKRFGRRACRVDSLHHSLARIARDIQREARR
jgi:hypothetical protein